MSATTQIPGASASADVAKVPRDVESRGQTGIAGAPRLELPASQAQDASRTDLSGATASDPADSIGRGSKRSLTGRKRAGSTTSSKRSQTAATTAATERTQRPVSADKTSPTKQPAPKKKSGFLSFLNCCAGSDDNADGAEGAAQNARQAVRPQSTKPTPQSQMQQVGNGSAGAKTTGAPLSLDEKGAVSSGNAANSSLQPTNSYDEKSPEHGNSVDMGYALAAAAALGGAGGFAVGVATKEQSRDNTATRLPPQLDTSETTIAESVMASNPAVTIQEATPILPPATMPTLSSDTEMSPIVPQELPSEEDQLITDRTPQQQALDTDIEMTDVGPSVPLSSNEVAPLPEDEPHYPANRESISQVDLPPPPPLQERQAQVAHAGELAGGGLYDPLGPTGTSRDTSRAPSLAEQQKWLLPSMRAEHRGRKCLILDLDETLVHSSFKVCRCVSTWHVIAADKTVDSPPSRLCHPRRD